MGHLWTVELTHIYIFAFMFTLRYLQPDINHIVCHRCRWHRWQICPRCRWFRWQICRRWRWYRWQFATGVVDTGGKFATGINNTSETGGNFAAGVVDTDGQPWAANISANFWKKSKRPQWCTQGLGGNWFMKKTRSKKSRDTVPLSQNCTVMLPVLSYLIRKKGQKQPAGRIQRKQCQACYPTGCHYGGVWGYTLMTGLLALYLQRCMYGEWRPKDSCLITPKTGARGTYPTIIPPNFAQILTNRPNKLKINCFKVYWFHYFGTW